MSNKELVVKLFTALSYIQLAYEDLEKVLNEITDVELIEAVEEFENEICSLQSLSDGAYETELAVEVMNNKITDILKRINNL